MHVVLLTLMKTQKNRLNSNAFTIIEVLIVLAIAGLILLIIFIAIPALRRNARNFERKSIASNVAAQMGEHFNNERSFPDETTLSGRQEMCRIIQDEITDFVGEVPTCNTTAFNNGDGHDCIGGESVRGYKVCFLQAVGGHGASGGAHDYVGPYDEIDLQTGHWCYNPNIAHDPNDESNPNTIVTSDTTGFSNKIISVRTKLENNIPFCKDFGTPKS